MKRWKNQIEEDEEEEEEEDEEDEGERRVGELCKVIKGKMVGDER